MREGASLQEKDQRTPHVYLCWRGEERSRLAVGAYESIGVNAMYLRGGTNALASMANDRIRNFIPEGASVTIIYEEGSIVQEYEAMMKVVHKLRQLKIDYQVKSIDLILANLYSRGVRVSDYF